MRAPLVLRTNGTAQGLALPLYSPGSPRRSAITCSGISGPGLDVCSIGATAIGWSGVPPTRYTLSARVCLRSTCTSDGSMGRAGSPSSIQRSVFGQWAWISALARSLSLRIARKNASWQWRVKARSALASGWGIAGMAPGCDRECPAGGAAPGPRRALQPVPGGATRKRSNSGGGGRCSANLPGTASGRTPNKHPCLKSSPNRADSDLTRGLCSTGSPQVFHSLST